MGSFCKSAAVLKQGIELTKKLLCRFCLAYENSIDEDYVTEKLFDCLRAGAIPVMQQLRDVYLSSNSSEMYQCNSYLQQLRATAKREA